MTEHELKKELIIHELTNMLGDANRKNEMLNILQDAIDINAFEVSWEYIYPMSKFDEVMRNLRPSQIADLVMGEDMCNPYFAYGGLYAFNTFSYDKIDQLFSFNDIADAVLERCDGFKWSCPFFNDIQALDLDGLRFLIMNTIVQDDIENIVSSFNNFLSETRGCDEQIFRMETDLEEVWFNMMGEDERFLEQTTVLCEAVKSGAFHITDRYWEMPSYDGHSFNGIRSFNELYDCENFARLEDEYADYLITYRDYEGLSKDTEKELDHLFSSLGI